MTGNPGRIPVLSVPGQALLIAFLRLLSAHFALHPAPRQWTAVCLSKHFLMFLGQTVSRVSKDRRICEMYPELNLPLRRAIK